jgi:diguanylate cyclase (GGDEF)-like protein
LTAVAKAIQNSVRRVDIVGRLGGEEFLVIMPHTSSETAFSIAERIRQTVLRWPFTALEHKVPVTISIGVGFYPAPSILNKNNLLQAVDGALYEAKRTGKNKVVAIGKTTDRRDN